MAYIGQSIKNGTFTDLGFTGTFNSSTTAFNLGTQVGSAAQLLVSKNGVIQRPGTDYTLATGGTQISFTTAPASGDSIFIVEISGAVGGPMNTDINGAELILDVDGDTSITADTDDQIDIKIAGADDFTFTANTFTAVSGSTIAAQALTATTITPSSNIDMNGTELILDADADTSITADTDDRVDLKIANVDVAQISTANSGDLVIKTAVSDKDFIVKGNDGGSEITALTLDMSGAGAATFNNDVTAFSDKRLKTDIKNIENSLDKVMKMQGVYYKRNDIENAKEQIGVLAQDIENILPQVVLTADDDMKTKSVDYGKLCAILIEAVKELKQEVNELKKDN